jgi:MSHA pilin protein MshC
MKRTDICRIDQLCGGVRIISQSGFTLVELIMVMIVTGVLAIAVMPRFANVNDFDAVGYADQLESLFRFAQKAAIAQRQLVYLDFGASPPTISLASSSSSCAAGAAVVLPGGAPATPKTTVTVQSSGDTRICFNALGKPYAPAFTALASALTVTVKYKDGSAAKVFYVEPETGYVHE